MAGVHFTGPILFAGKNHEKKWFENLPIDKNPDYVVYFDDFDRIGFDSNTGHRWTVVKDSGASVEIAADQLNGLVNLNSTATTDNDGASIQKNEIFQVQANKDLWFETKVRTSDVTDTDLCFGFTINFATNPENMLAATDRIVFQKDDIDEKISPEILTLESNPVLMRRILERISEQFYLSMRGLEKLDEELSNSRNLFEQKFFLERNFHNS